MTMSVTEVKEPLTTFHRSCQQAPHFGPYRASDNDSAARPSDGHPQNAGFGHICVRVLQNRSQLPSGSHACCEVALSYSSVDSDQQPTADVHLEGLGVADVPTLDGSKGHTRRAQRREPGAFSLSGRGG